MAVSYNRLWKLLIDKELKKTELMRMVGLSNSTLTRLTQNKHVSLSIIDRICCFLNCEINDVVEIKKDN